MAWTLVDYQVTRLSAKAGTGFAGGGGQVAQITCDAVPPGYAWRVEKISCAVIGLNTTQQQNGTASPFVYVFDQAPAAGIVPIQGTQLAVYTDPLNGGFSYFDADDESEPLTIRGGDGLYIVFDGVANPNVCLARIQYQLMLGSAGQPQPVAGATPSPRISAAL